MLQSETEVSDISSYDVEMKPWVAATNTDTIGNRAGLHMPFNTRLGAGPGQPLSGQRKVAVFLDRDGVIVKDVHFLTSPDQIQYLPEVVSALKMLQERYHVVIVTNQSGVARGHLTEDGLLSIHSAMVQGLDRDGVILDAIYYCPHLPQAPIEIYNVACNCRKPGPGMFMQAKADWGIDLQSSWMVGDRPRDVVAARAAGVEGIMLSDRDDGSGSLCTTADLRGAVDLILARDSARIISKSN